MAELQIATYKPSFFTERGKTATQKDQAVVKDPGIVDAGGAGDCGFRSIVVGLIDNVLQNPQDNHQLFYSLIKRYSKKYDFPAPLEGLHTPQDRSLHALNALSTAYDRLVFIVRMGDLLRKMAVKVIVANPEIYRGSIIAEHEHTSPKEMRKPGTWIDKSAIAAVANVLQLPIQIKVTKGSKVIFARDGYGPKLNTTKVTPVTLQLDSGHYCAEVADKTFFNNLPTQSVSFEVLAKEDEVADPEMSELLARIEESDKEAVRQYKLNVTRLTKWLSCEEIDKDKLLDIYIAGMGDSDCLRCRISQVGLDHGNQSFFEDAIKKKSGVQLKTNPSHDSETLLVNELVHAIARAMSIGQLDENIFEEIEKRNQRKMAP